MGMTGVGKSTLIESLCETRSLGISKNQLESATQGITVYELVNVTVKDIHTIEHDKAPIYLVDTPGFLDHKISEMTIIKSLQEWAKPQTHITAIMYLDRITDNRMSGRKRTTLEMFKALTGDGIASRMTVVTTMWDNLWNEQQVLKGSERFQEMEDLHWQDLLSQGGQILKFTNTQESALTVIDECLTSAKRVGGYFAFERAVNRHHLENSPFGAPVHQNLLQRTVALHQRIQSLEEELKGLAGDDTQAELLAICLKQRAEAEADLKMFQQELQMFGPPPAAPGDEISESSFEHQESKGNYVRKAVQGVKTRIKSVFSFGKHDDHR
ncbi:hypothetical protein BJ165DRAFT_1423653 [Panaeolus papilionaceus]|nr:hypothetical protein BJ165DRAFT_1423653 [Panaeolus papilionaceus]